MRRVQHHSFEVLSTITFLVFTAIGIIVFNPTHERDIFLSTIGLFFVSGALFLLGNSIYFFLSKRAQHRKRILWIIIIGLSIVVYIYYSGIFGFLASIIYSIFTVAIPPVLGFWFHFKYPETSEKLAITAKE